MNGNGHQSDGERMGRIVDAMIEAFDNHPESKPDDRCVLLTEDSTTRGMVIHGYDTTADVVMGVLDYLGRALSSPPSRVVFVPVVVEDED